MGQHGDGGLLSSTLCGSPGAEAGLVGQPEPGLGDGAMGFASSFITGSPGAWASPVGQVEPGAGPGPGA